MTRLNALAEETRTMIFYESPYRLVKTLTQFMEIFGLTALFLSAGKSPRSTKKV